MIIEAPFTEEKLKAVNLVTGQDVIFTWNVSNLVDDGGHVDRQRAGEMLTQARDMISRDGVLKDKISWTGRTKIDDAAQTMRTTYHVDRNPVPLILLAVVIAAAVGAYFISKALKSIEVTAGTAGATGKVFVGGLGLALALGAGAWFLSKATAAKKAFT